MNTLLLISMGIIIVLIFICFVLTMINSSKINTLLDYSDDGDIITALKEYYKKVDDLAVTVNKNSDAATLSRLASCEADAGSSLKKIGVVNFDAFDDVKGNLSFALALLNNNNDGIILTSIYGNNSAHSYIREIRSGKTAVKLLNEETRALEIAKNNIRKGSENESQE